MYWLLKSGSPADSSANILVQNLVFGTVLPLTTFWSHLLICTNNNIFHGAPNITVTWWFVDRFPFFWFAIPAAVAEENSHILMFP